MTLLALLLAVFAAGWMAGWIFSGGFFKRILVLVVLGVLTMVVITHAEKQSPDTSLPQRVAAKTREWNKEAEHYLTHNQDRVRKSWRQLQTSGRRLRRDAEDRIDEVRHLWYQLTHLSSVN